MCEGSKKKSHHKHAVAIRSHQALRVIFREPSPKDSSNMQLKQLLDIILCEEFEFTSEKSPERYHMARKGQREEERRVQVHAFGQEKNDFKRRCTLLQCKKKKWKGAGEI